MKNKFLLLIFGLCLLFTACKDEVPFKPELVVFPETLFTFEEEGGDCELIVQSNLDWIISSQPNWVTTTLSQGDKEYGVVTVSAQPNESYDRREGKIVFRSSEYNLSDTVYASQLQKNAIIVVQDSCTISSVSCELKFEVRSNIDYVVQTPAWIEHVKTRGLTDREILFKVAANESYDSREGKIVFRSNEYNLSDTVYVSQLQKNAIIVAQDSCMISSESCKLEFEVLSNVDYVVQTPAWIEHVKTRGLTDRKLIFKVAANYEYDSRVGEITFKTDALSQSIIVLQKGYDDTVERDALVAFYHATGGDNWKKNDNWCSDKPLNEWYGVYVDYKNSVYYLNLYGNQLSGSIPSDLGNLVNLKYLYLSGNQFIGSIPSELGNLTNLTYLELSNNQLDGDIPSELGNLANLYFLNLSGNQFIGSIPSELGNLTNLTSLSLSNNQLEGDIPSFILNHKNWGSWWRSIIPGNNLDINNIIIPAPEFTVKDIKGNIIKSDELYKRNKVTILYWWGKWCPYSLAYNNTLISLQQMYGSKGLEILGGYVCSEDETNQDIMDYIAKNIPWINFIQSEKNEGSGKEDNFIEGYIYYGVPYVMAVDSNKNIIFSDYIYSRDDLPLFLYEYFE